ncbi:MAG: lipopolysaccharide biosynthesis protein [Halobacteriaceae archaeon]
MDEDIPAEEREALLSITHGAVVTSSGISVQRALSWTIEFVLTRGFGAALYGVYAFAWRIAFLLFRFGTFGGAQTIQRYVPAYDDPGKRQQVAGLAYATAAAVGSAIAVGLVLGAPRINVATVADPLFPPTLGVLAALIVLVGVVKVHAALLRAVGSARGAVLFNRVLRPGVRLAAAAVALALGYSVVGVVGAVVAGTAALAFLGFPATVRATGIRPTLRGTRSEARRFFDHAAPIAASSLGIVFQNRIDVVLVGVLLTATAAGVYNVVLVLVAIAWIPLVAFNQLMPPVASDLHASGKTETLDTVYSSITRLVLTGAIPIVVVQVVYGEALLGLFGPTFVRGYVPLVVYLGGVLMGSAVGGNGWLMMMTDHQYARLALNWTLAGANVLLTYLFIREFGLVGAALGTSIAIGVQNLSEAFVLRHFEGLWPFDRSFLDPLLAGAAMGVVMVGVRAALPGAVGVVAGTVGGVAVFLGVLCLRGVHPHDRLVVRELAARYRRQVVGYST